MAVYYGPSASYYDGSSSEKAAVSAIAIKKAKPDAPNGVYWINLPTVGPTQLFCIMDDEWDGGGWIMTMKATQGTTFNYNSVYWTGNNTLNPTALNQNDGDAKFNSFNYYNSKDMLARWPDIGSGGSISNLGNWIWLQNNFIDGARATPLAYHSNPSAYARWQGMQREGQGNFFGDVLNYDGWGTPWSTQTDVRFYGFNYTNAADYGTNARVRWGFGWNENGGGLYPATGSGVPGSNDVSGGIGMDSGFGSFSAGDRINCCQNRIGMNRSARVEIYVR
jgi:hypothetical protein